MRLEVVNSLSQSITLPLGLSLRNIPLNVETPHMPLYGLDGAIVTGPTKVLPRQLEISGSLFEPNKVQIRDQWDEILRVLMRPPLKIYKWSDRYINAYCQGAPQDWINAGAELGVRIPVVAFDPYWYGEKESHSISSSKSISYTGNVPVSPLITVPSGHATIYNITTGNSIIVHGTSQVVIDSEAFTVKQGSIDRLDIVNESWLMHGFKLVPGMNTITSSSPIVVEFNPRYY